MAIVIGMLVAFMMKMAAAVALGSVISKLTPLLVAALTSASFIGIAIALWRKPVERPAKIDRPQIRPRRHGFVRGDFLFGMGRCGPDHGRHHGRALPSPIMVWAGAVAAMVTKGALAASIGASLRV
jgi:putative Ca2+/H+ antiporter (TMEM165/GDT1 family)